MRELKALYKIQASNLPFAIYSEFGSTNISIILQSNKDINFVEDFNSDKGFVFSPFENTLRKVLIKEDAKFNLTIDKSYKRKVININDFFNNKTTLSDENHIQEKNNFEQKFKTAQEFISKNILQKVVISRRKTVILKDTFDLIDTYINLVLKNPNSYNYLFFHPKIGIWLGASPELFLEQNDFLLKTTSLAGTKLNTEEWTQKERDEQQYVSNYILNIFKSEKLKTSISTTENFSFGNIDHLKNIITTELNEDCDINNIIEKLHPTPAVCGVPKKESYNFILTKENYDREFYTGFLGYTSPDFKNLFVNIRCMKFDLEKAYLYVGCGITNESIFEKEWQETERKSQLLKSLI